MSKESTREWIKKHPQKSIEYARRHSLKTKYNLSLEEYNRLLQIQNGVCAACGLPERINDRTGKVRTFLSVDHNHLTARVRGLLCHHCNAALGHVGDNIQLLYKLIGYLESTNADN